jgi:hypothetical protein
MKRRTFQAAEAELSRVSRVKTIAPLAIGQLGPEMIDFFKESVQKRQHKLSQLAACWEKLVPSTLIEHCALESLHRGTLTVLVDSSSHLYELKQLLLSGLQQQLTIACKFAGLKKIALKPGRWYEATENGVKQPRF